MTFSPEEDLGYQNLAQFRWKPRDLSIFPLTPLARLLKNEEKKVDAEKMHELERLLLRRLSIPVASFLFNLVGGSWDEKFYFPGLARAQDAVDYTFDILPTVEERLEILMGALNGEPKLPKALLIASQPYFLTTRSETIQIYDTVLRDDVRFPTNFFIGDNGRKARIVIRHLYEDLKGLEPAQVFSRATRRDFDQYKLLNLLKMQFDGSVTKGVEHAYPKADFPQLYKDDKPVTGLGHLVDSLDALFGD